MKNCIDQYERLRKHCARLVNLHPDDGASVGQVIAQWPWVAMNSSFTCDMAQLLDAFADAAKKPLIGREVGNVMGVRFLSYEGFPPGVVLCRSGSNAKLFRIKDGTITEIE